MLHRLLPVVALLSLATPPALAYEPEALHVPLIWSAPEAPPGLRAAPTRRVPLVWLRPSLDVQVAVRDGLERRWTVGLTPGVGYGLAWCPPGWRLTPELVSLDLHASAGLADGVLRGRVLAMLTLGGVVTVGAGLDAALGSGTVRDRFGLAVAVGMRYAL